MRGLVAYFGAVRIWGDERSEFSCLKRLPGSFLCRERGLIAGLLRVAWTPDTKNLVGESKVDYEFCYFSYFAI